MKTETLRKWQRGLLDFVVQSRPGLDLDKRAEGFVSLFEKHLEPGSRILDIGGGWGFYREPLTRRGHNVMVLDVVKPGLQKAPLVIYPGGRMPFPDKSFDASLLITVMHHVPDLEPLLAEARRITRGLLIVVEDLYHHPLGRWWTILRDQVYNFEFLGHPRQFKKREEWLEFFEKRGYSLLEYREVYTWLSGLRILNGVFVFKV